ncbi:hypothetical protein LCGC14_1751310 [marine sediment metagenome]|uniref:Uncharacterized protein n=1 Tax=marine sediment metagenome TaxID=412755 RepID=A0A0F9HR44_9ZZZZ
MNEINHNAKRAQDWRRTFTSMGSRNHYEWCIRIGLWETSNFAEPSPYRMFEWSDQFI